MPMLRSRQPLKSTEHARVARRTSAAATLLREKTDYKVSQLRGRLRGGIVNRTSGLWIGPDVRIIGNVHLGDRIRLHGHVRLDASRGGVIRIGRGTYIGPRTELHCEEAIRVGDGSWIAWEVLIMDTDHHVLEGSEKTGPVTIGSNVWIGARACVLKGVTIGEGAVIAAGAVVTSDVAPGYLAAGVPARPLRPVKWSI